MTRDQKIQEIMLKFMSDELSSDDAIHQLTALGMTALDAKERIGDLEADKQ